MRVDSSPIRTSGAYARIEGAGQHRTPERPFASVPQVFALRAALPGRYRALVLAAAFTGLRWGELIALRRCDVDLTAKVLRVHRSLGQTQGGEMVVGLPEVRGRRPGRGVA